MIFYSEFLDRQEKFDALDDDKKKRVEQYGENIFKELKNNKLFMNVLHEDMYEIVVVGNYYENINCMLLSGDRVLKNKICYYPVEESLIDSYNEKAVRLQDFKKIKKQYKINDDEKILLSFIKNFLRNFKEGFIITDKNLYSRNRDGEVNRMSLSCIRNITADDSKVYINGSSILEVRKDCEVIRDVIEAELVFLRNGIYMNDIENDYKNEILVDYNL